MFRCSDCTDGACTIAGKCLRNYPLEIPVSIQLKEVEKRSESDADAKPSILQEAQQLIHGARITAYGHPADNFSNIAELCSAYLKRKYGREIQLDADDVAIFNILQKVSRLAKSPRHRDSLVDIAGYAGTIERLSERS